eukprot:1674439-Rhodomonas_salina.3
MCRAKYLGAQFECDVDVNKALHLLVRVNQSVTNASRDKTNRMDNCETSLRRLESFKRRLTDSRYIPWAPQSRHPSCITSLNPSRL